MTSDSRHIPDELRDLAHRLQHLISEARTLGLEPDGDLVGQIELLMAALIAELELQDRAGDKSAGNP